LIDKELIDLAAIGLRWTFACFPLIGFQMVSSAFFQSVGKPNNAIILSMTRQVLFLIPILFILPNYYGITGIWVSMPISDFISFIVAFLFLGAELKTMRAFSAKKS
jgi:Na+-driven multidrug efflux pump